MNNLKQIGLAMHNYHDVHRTLPPAYHADASDRPLLSWRVLILPYLEQDALYREFHLNEPWDSDHNKKLIERIPAVYQSPGSAAGPGRPTTSPSAARTRYSRARTVSVFRTLSMAQPTLC